jgi:hypothetical protein
MEPLIGPQPPPKVFVLCFDGTGNKFSGDESDSNVLKIFRVSIISHCAASPLLGNSLLGQLSSDA